ncbi:PI-PLC domain-containing protein [Kitasatospora sp. NPDC085879]|uniref:PI-PLC domain-containing protein n=1 Tax=Kitasatospora sp. NPDC085879 TaxID=3154769 RepID=UPI00343443F0
MRPIRTGLLLTAQLALLAGLSAPVAAAAAGPPAPGAYFVQSVVTGLNAADAGGAVDQHNPKGNEDHQQWTLRASGGASVLESADQAGRCLGRSGDRARVVGCGDAAAAWEVLPSGASSWRLKAPGAEQYLSLAPKPAGASYPAGLQVAGAGPLADFYLTPTAPPTAPMPGPQERTLDQLTFLTAHNAYANGVDGGFAPPFVNLAPNQTRGIQQQLADGVRGFMLDIHQTPDGAILCHNSCTLVSRPVALWVDLQRITDFLAANRGEFVTVFLEDYVSPEVLRGEITRVRGLNDVLFRPDTAGVREHGWPRVADLVASNRRLMIFTDHSRDADRAAGLTRDSFGVMYQREWTVENYWSMGSGLGSSDWSCYSRWYGGDDVLPLTRTEPGFRPLFVMNHFRDVTIAPTASNDNGKLLDRAQRFCRPAARKKPVFLAVDRYDLGNPGAAVAALNGWVDGAP